MATGLNETRETSLKLFLKDAGPMRQSLHRTETCGGENHPPKGVVSPPVRMCGGVAAVSRIQKKERTDR